MPQHHAIEPNELLYSLGQSLSAVLDLSDLLIRVVDAAVKLTQAGQGWIIIPDPDDGLPRIRAQRRAGSAHTEPLYVVTDDPLIRELMASGQARRLDSSTGQTDRSLLYVPLIAKGQANGHLAVMKEVGEPPFTPLDEDMLAGLAGYAAIAIENALLYQQAIEHNRELSILVESANAVSSSLDLDQVLNAIARQMMRSLNAHWCIISAYEPVTATIQRLAEHRMAFAPPASAPESAGPLQSLAKPGQIHMFYCDDPQLPPQGYALLTAHGYSRLLLLPLQIEGEIMGIVELGSIHDETRWASSTIGSCLNVALKLAQMLKDARQHTHEWRQQFFRMARVLIHTASVDWLSIHALAPGSNRLVRVLAYGSGFWVGQQGPQLEIDELPTVSVVLHEQRVATLSSADPLLDPQERELFRQTRSGTMLAIPLVFKNKTVGLVELFDLDPSRQFSAREMGLAYTIAGQAAIALEHAHLVSDLQRSLAELKAMQSQLVRAARLSALGELTAMIAHQVNNPLTTVLGDAEMLVQDLPSDDPRHASAVAILRAGQRAKTVIDRLLNMARGDETPRKLDVNHTIEEALALVGSQITRHNTRIDLELSPDLPPVLAVPGQLEDVWMNLLTNAADAIRSAHREPGRIIVRSELLAEEQVICVQVIDNGSGLDSEQARRVFDPFYTTKPHGEGTGLGMYICRQIVQEHNGQIDITGTSGRGATVTVRLPVQM
ncbi:MAG: hypothetical protein Kow00124_18480 [Anaerolineae bacterium]